MKHNINQIKISGEFPAVKCSKCSFVWHESKDHNKIKLKEGNIESQAWDISAMLGSQAGRGFVLDGVAMHRFSECGVSEFPDNINGWSKIFSDADSAIYAKNLDEFADKTMQQFNFDRLSPYHQKYINNPDFVFVNCCNVYVKKADLIKGQCPYHQQVLGDGTLLYDEFNQDGEK